MKHPKAFAVSFLIAAALAIAAIPTGAQTTTSAPVVVKQIPAKAVWLKAEVIHVDNNSIMVREQATERAIHTFTYDPKIKDKMQQIVDNGGYQTGDKVRILYLPGQSVALKIHGKPSKPI
jgi:hypothetical protein